MDTELSVVIFILNYSEEAQVGDDLRLEGETLTTSESIGST